MPSNTGLDPLSVSCVTVTSHTPASETCVAYTESSDESELGVMKAGAVEVAVPPS